MVSGEPFVVNCRTTMMPVLSVNSWDTLLMVILLYSIHNMQYHAVTSSKYLHAHVALNDYLTMSSRHGLTSV